MSYRLCIKLMGPSSSHRELHYYTTNKKADTWTG